MSANHISRIRVANTDRSVEVEIYPCDFQDMLRWERRIQRPFIATSGGIGSDWRWPRLFLQCHLTEQLFNRQALAFQLRVANPDGDAVPVAQALFSLPYNWPADKTEHCVFIWFIASTPVEALQVFGVHERFSVLPPLLDIAVQISEDHGWAGRIGLHAAAGRSETESDEIAERYRRYALRQRKKTGMFYTFPFRRDDGRLFYFTPEDARIFAAKQDDLR